MSFGERLTKIRRQTNLSQEELAEKMNVSRQTVYRWESDVCSPKIEQIKSLCDIFKVSADYFLIRDEVLLLETAKEEISMTESENTQVSTNETVRINKWKVAGLIAIVIVSFISFISFLYFLFRDYIERIDPTLIQSISDVNIHSNAVIACIIAFVIFIVTLFFLIKYILKKKGEKNENN